MRSIFTILAITLMAGEVVADLLDYDRLRAGMIREIEVMVSDTRDYTGKEALAKDVITAMAEVPRHEFVPASLRDYAYFNQALPIGHGQTISQPYIVALMTDLAGIDKNSVVLEVGTGSGYQAAVLSRLARHVYTIEIVEPLGQEAKQTLERLGYDNVTVRIGDGYNGWAEHAPFDTILVTAAPERLPQPLLEQLKPGGRLIIPVGRAGAVQSLRIVEKDESGEIQEKDVLPVAFVPLTRQRQE